LVLLVVTEGNGLTKLLDLEVRALARVSWQRIAEARKRAKTGRANVLPANSVTIITQ
jgi:hypothetical protein